MNAVWLRNRECPDFTVARPCGEQLDEYGARCGARYGAWFDLTGKISTPSLLKKFLISVPDLISDRGKTDYIGPHQLIPNEPVSTSRSDAPCRSPASTPVSTDFLLNLLQAAQYR
jgi:hypothetical protein